MSTLQKRDFAKFALCPWGQQFWITGEAADDFSNGIWLNFTKYSVFGEISGGWATATAIWLDVSSQNI